MDGVPRHVRRKLRTVRRDEERVEGALGEDLPVGQGLEAPAHGTERAARRKLGLDDALGAERHGRGGGEEIGRSPAGGEIFLHDAKRQGAERDGVGLPGPSPDLPFREGAVGLPVAAGFEVGVGREGGDGEGKRAKGPRRRFAPPLPRGALRRGGKREERGVRLGMDGGAVRQEREDARVGAVPMAVRSEAPEADAANEDGRIPAQGDALRVGAVAAGPDGVEGERSAHGGRREGGVVQPGGGRVPGPRFVAGGGERRDVREVVADADAKLRGGSGPVYVAEGRDAVDPFARHRCRGEFGERRLVLLDRDVERAGRVAPRARVGGGDGTEGIVAALRTERRERDGAHPLGTVRRRGDGGVVRIDREQLHAGRADIGVEPERQRGVHAAHGADRRAREAGAVPQPLVRKIRREGAFDGRAGQMKIPSVRERERRQVRTARGNHLAPAAVEPRLE